MLSTPPASHVQDLHKISVMFRELEAVRRAKCGSENVTAEEAEGR